MRKKEKNEKFSFHVFSACRFQTPPPHTTGLRFAHPKVQCGDEP
jgi:hypothetical protein